jgi:LmbE family N-acetylglucosaminyl deacetylase
MLRHKVLWSLGSYPIESSFHRNWPDKITKLPWKVNGNTATRLPSSKRVDIVPVLHAQGESGITKWAQMLRQTLGTVLSSYRGIASMTATDITGTTAGNSCLVLAPHADDETFGCGATILRKRALSTPVKVVIATDGRHSTKSSIISPDQLVELRRQEALVACSHLGVESDDVTFLNFEDGTLHAHLPDLVSVLSMLIERFRPAEILVTSSQDGHPDHRMLNKAAYEAAESRTDIRLLEYPIWFWHPSSWISRQESPVSQANNLFIRPISEIMRMRRYRVQAHPYLPQKKEAMGAYASQVTNLTGEVDWSMMAPWMLRNFTWNNEIFFERRDWRTIDRMV